MCDLQPLFLSLGIAGGLIVASAAAIAVASALNGGIFTAPGAPIPMLVAAALATSAVVAFVTGGNRATEFFVCSGSPVACEGQLANLTEALEAIAGILAVQALAAVAVAAVAWIPWAAQPAMWVIVTALVGQLAFIPVVIAFANELLKCVQSLGARQLPSPLIAAAALVLVALPIIYASRARRITT